MSGRARTIAVGHVAAARSQWDGDCRQIERGLHQAGFPFGATGYRLVAEALAMRLHEGVSAALASLPVRVRKDPQVWRAVHDAIHGAIDVQFGGPLPLLIGGDPGIAKAINAAHDQVQANCRSSAVSPGAD